MRPAQERLRADLHATDFKNLIVPLINNWQAQEITAAEDARQGLYEQIPNPVRWTDTIRAMVNKGIKVFVEVGPGSVLSGLNRNIDPTLLSVKFGEPADLEKVKRALA